MWAGVAVVLAGGGFLAFGVFGVHTLVFDNVVDEDGPVFASGAAAGADSSQPSGGAGAQVPVDATSPDTPAPDTTSPDTTAPDTAAAEPVISTLATGQFEGRGRYSGVGTAVVLTDGSEQRFLRFESDFEVSNGPDLFVYLGNGSDAYSDPEQWIELGVLSGNIGAQNYEIPVTHPTTGAPIDLERFDHVSVWCRRFSSTFAIAQLS